MSLEGTNISDPPLEAGPAVSEDAQDKDIKEEVKDIQIENENKQNESEKTKGESPEPESKADTDHDHIESAAIEEKKPSDDESDAEETKHKNEENDNSILNRQSTLESISQDDFLNDDPFKAISTGETKDNQNRVGEGENDSDKLKKVFTIDSSSSTSELDLQHNPSIISLASSTETTTNQDNQAKKDEEEKRDKELAGDYPGAFIWTRLDDFGGAMWPAKVSNSLSLLVDVELSEKEENRQKELKKKQSAANKQPEAKKPKGNTKTSKNKAGGKGKAGGKNAKNKKNVGPSPTIQEKFDTLPPVPKKKLYFVFSPLFSWIEEQIPLSELANCEKFKGSDEERKKYKKTVKEEYIDKWEDAFDFAKKLVQIAIEENEKLNPGEEELGEEEIQAIINEKKVVQGGEMEVEEEEGENENKMTDSDLQGNILEVGKTVYYKDVGSNTVSNAIIVELKNIKSRSTRSLSSIKYEIKLHPHYPLTMGSRLSLDGKTWKRLTDFQVNDGKLDTDALIREDQKEIISAITEGLEKIKESNPVLASELISDVRINQSKGRKRSRSSE